jgi:hypothetical protein
MKTVAASEGKRGISRAATIRHVPTFMSIQSARDGDKSQEEGAVLMILMADVSYPLANACSNADGELKLVVLLSSPLMNIPDPRLPSLRRRNFELWGKTAIRGIVVMPGSPFHEE